MINQDRLPTRDSREFIDFIAAGHTRPHLGSVLLLQGPRIGRRFCTRAGAVRRPRQEVRRLCRRALQQRGAALLRTLRGQGSAEAGRQSAAGGALEGHCRRPARAAGDGACALGHGATILRRRGDQPDRGRLQNLARRRNTDRHGRPSHPRPRQRRGRQTGRSRRVRPVGRARRPSAAGRGHARAQGGLFHEPAEPRCDRSPVGAALL
jgi:hypothetical protein